MRVLIISPSLEEPGGRGLHTITNNLVDALKEHGHEIGLLVGLPHHKMIEESEEYNSKIDHVFLQHYALEGRASFKYVIKGGYSRLNAARAVANRSIYKLRKIDIVPDYLSGKNTILHKMDFAIESPFFYQFLNRNHEKRIKRNVQNACKKYGIDLVVVTSPSLIYSKWLGKTKVVQFVHDFMPIEVIETPPDNDTPMVFARQIYAACFGSDLLLANSEDTKGKILESNPEAKVQVLYGAVRKPDPAGSTILTEKGLRKDHYLVFASALEKRKNLENIMSAYALVFNEIGHMPLVIIGSAGYGFKDIYRHYESLPPDVKEKIIFTGYASSVDKDSLFANARACVFPTIYEGLGLPIVEALAAGTPALASKVGAAPEAGKNAVLYIDNPYDVKEIASGITEITNNESLRRKLMAHAPEVVDFFSEKNFANRISSVMNLLEKEV